jgi:hypothetical protein
LGVLVLAEGEETSLMLESQKKVFFLAVSTEKN